MGGGEDPGRVRQGVQGAPSRGIREFFQIIIRFFFVIPGARLSRSPSLSGPLTHLCSLEVGYGGVWAPNFGGAAPGFEPRTSCMLVRSHSHYATGAAQIIIVFLIVKP